MKFDICLVYFFIYLLDLGWYWFGGEGYLVDINCIKLNEKYKKLLNKLVGK